MPANSLAAPSVRVLLATLRIILSPLINGYSNCGIGLLRMAPSTSEPPLILFYSLQTSNAERKCLERLAAFPFSRAFKRLDRSRLVNMDNGVKLI